MKVYNTKVCINGCVYHSVSGDIESATLDGIIEVMNRLGDEWKMEDEWEMGISMVTVL